MDWSNPTRFQRWIPKQFRKLYEQAMGGKSRDAAIQAHCLSCMGWQASEVPLCTATACPLYPYRPLVALKGSTGEVSDAQKTQRAAALKVRREASNTDEKAAVGEMTQASVDA